MKNTQTEYLYVAATEDDLNELLAGREAGIAKPWPGTPPHLAAGLTGVVFKRGRHRSDPVRPLVLVTLEEELKRLVGRFAQLRSDLSPLTAWCHLLTPQLFESLDSPTRDAELDHLQAAWTGLVVAEALLLAERPLANLRISACLATQSFAMARTKALWSHISASDVANRFEAANRLFRSEGAIKRSDFRAKSVRLALQPISASLAAVPAAEVTPIRSELRPIVASLRALKDARSDKDPQEARRFAEPLVALVPEADRFLQLPSLTPELRLQVFDRLIDKLSTINVDLGWSPGLRQTVKTLPAVRWNSIVQRRRCLARWLPAGEAEAGTAGVQPAEE